MSERLEKKNPTDASWTKTFQLWFLISDVEILLTENINLCQSSHSVQNFKQF